MLCPMYLSYLIYKLFDNNNLINNFKINFLIVLIKNIFFSLKFCFINYTTAISIPVFEIVIYKKNGFGCKVIDYHIKIFVIDKN